MVRMRFNRFLSYSKRNQGYSLNGNSNRLVRFNCLPLMRLRPNRKASLRPHNRLQPMCTALIFVPAGIAGVNLEVIWEMSAKSYWGSVYYGV